MISTRPLIDVCPVVPAAMAGRQTVQWDKDSCADAGFLKIDLLGLGMLSAVERCVEEIGRARGERLDLSRIPLDDEEAFESIRAAETTGVFQIESRAQMQMLPRTQPRDLDDLIVQVALVRPGPIQGGAIHPYIERRKLLREDPDLRDPLRAPAAGAGAGGDAGDDRLPGAGDRGGDGAGRLQLLGGRGAAAGDEPQALRGGDPRAPPALRRRRRRQRRRRGIAERVWDQIKGFSGFGFPKAHSAAFGLLAYQSAWLRIHYGPEFLCSLLNEQPMGFYPPDSLVHEAQRRGIRVAPPDANRSRVLCHVETPRAEGRARRLVVRVGLGYVKGVRKEEMEALVAERERGGPYRGIAELASRSRRRPRRLERLAWAGALDGIPAGSEGERRAGPVAGRRRRRRPRRPASGTQLALPMEPPAPPELEPLGSGGG